MARNLADGGTWNTIAGQPTDDSELALDLARTLVNRVSFSSEAVAAANAGWYASRPFDIGSGTRQALSAAAAAAQDKAGAAREAANRESQANGALMRCAPIGVWARDAAEAAAAARQDAALTHPHPICQAASAAFVGALATGIGGGDREAMLRAAEATMPEPGPAPLRAALAQAGCGQGPSDFTAQQGWVLIAFQNAFRHLAAGTVLEAAVINTVAPAAIPTPMGRSAARCWAQRRGAWQSRRGGGWRCWRAGRSRRLVWVSPGLSVIGQMICLHWRRHSWRGVYRRELKN